jgi:HEAT repeat protein
MNPGNKFPFSPRGYYLLLFWAQRLLPTAIYDRLFPGVDNVVLPRPLPGTPQMWLDAVAGNDSRAWKDATLILGGITERDKLDVHPFIAALSHPDGDVVFWSLCALGRMGDPAKIALSSLKTVLKHPEFGNRCQAINTLRVLAIEDEHVQNSIAEMLGDANPSVRSDAVRALESAKPLPASIVSQIQKLLSDTDDDVRHYAARCLDLDEPESRSNL